MSRIAYLTLEAPREGQASYVHVHEIAEGLRRRGNSVDIFLPRYTGARESPGIARRLWEYFWLQACLIWRWRNYDLIYVRGHYMAFFVAVFARWTNKPIVHEVNGPYLDITVTYPWTRRVERLLNWLQRSQYRCASALIAVTPQLQQWLKNEGCRNTIKVVANGANLNLFNPKRAPLGGLPARYVVFFGGFARWQGIPVMIEALASHLWPADVALVMIGDGQMAPEVREAAQRRKNLVYLGRLPYADVGAVVVGAIAGLVPKMRDDDTEKTGLFPIKLFEILSCGAPAIVSDYPGQADLVRAAECGLVVPPGDAGALASAVADLASDKARRDAMGSRGYTLIAKEHSWDSRAEVTARIIAQAMTVSGVRA